MTPAQLATLKAYILADQVLSAYPQNTDGAYDIAIKLNLTAVPDYIVWRTSVSQDEIMLNGFDWTRVDNLSVGAARVWQWMFDNGAKSFNPSRVNIRAGIDQVWKGTSPDLAVRAVVYTHCKRSATVFEKIFASGSGSDASPSTMELESPVSYQDVMAARNS
jgi:hypothetical protein